MAKGRRGRQKSCWMTREGEGTTRRETESLHLVSSFLLYFQASLNAKRFAQGATTRGVVRQKGEGQKSGTRALHTLQQFSKRGGIFVSVRSMFTQPHNLMDLSFVELLMAFTSFRFWAVDTFTFTTLCILKYLRACGLVCVCCCVYDTLFAHGVRLTHSQPQTRAYATPAHTLSRIQVYIHRSATRTR